MGRMVGNYPKGEDIYRAGQGNMHDPESFRKLWEEVGAEAGVTFNADSHFEDSDAWLETNPNSWHVKGSKPLVYTVSIE